MVCYPWKKMRWCPCRMMRCWLCRKMRCWLCRKMRCWLCRKKSLEIVDEVENIEIPQENSQMRMKYCEKENINEIPNEFDNLISNQDLSNELNEVEKDKLFYKNIETYDVSIETENYITNCSKNESDENKCYENSAARIKCKSLILENHERKLEFPNGNQIVEKKENLIDETVDDIQLKELRGSTIKKETKDIAEEILDLVLSEIILVTEMKMLSEFSKDFVKNILINAVHYVSIERLAIEILDELLYETTAEIMQSVIWKPLGFANPKGYCYLNSVVQVLGSCEDFKQDIYDHNLNTTDKTKDFIFVDGLFDLIKAIREHKKENLNKSLDIVQQNITESSFGDDVYKCFMNLLTRVSNVIKTNIERPSDHFTSLPITLSEKAKNTFTRFKNRNPGFVFDNFYGQLTFQTVCKKCEHLCNESFQMIKSLPLPVPNSNSSETLNSCIDLFFKDSDVEVDEPMKCKCDNGSTMSLKSISKLTHGPKYLFIYLNRGSYTDDGVKNNTHVTCDDLTIHIKTLEDQSIKYKLISVIDHVGDSAYGHYYCKCSFETEYWWLLNDSQVSLLTNEKKIVTKNTIVFLFKIIS